MTRSIPRRSVSGTPSVRKGTKTAPQADTTVSVAIICHNYGRFLREAVDSVLAQTLLPCEVVIVDDASTDDTEAVAREYEARGVRYVRVDTGNVWINRIRITEQLRGKWVLCLDADNVLPANYLESAMNVASQDQRCGAVYPSLARFGDDVRFVDLSSPQLPLSSANYIDAAAVYRREAVMQTGLTNYSPDPKNTAEDWVMAKRVVGAGWTSHHNPVPVHYRVHDSNKHANQIRAKLLRRLGPVVRAGDNRRSTRGTLASVVRHARVVGVADVAAKPVSADADRQLARSSIRRSRPRLGVSLQL